MSRIAKMPIIIPSNVDVIVDIQTVIVKGNKGRLTRTFNKVVKIVHINNIVTLYPRNNCKDGWAQAGTARSLLNSMLIGVNNGFTRKLQLIGVGYRAAIKENIIIMYLGFTHPVYYKLPTGVIAECPVQNEILISGADKQVIGQVAADIRSYRQPEPYKGKGIKYEYEIIRSKEAKKK